MLINTTQNIPTAKERIISLNTMAYNVLKNNFQQSFDIINKAENPQEVLDLFGTDATSLFQASGATIKFLKFVNPAYVPPTSENTYIFNPDGTVTLNVPVVTPEE